MKMENDAEKPTIDIDAKCRLCHHRLDDDKSVGIFDDGMVTSLPLSVLIKIFGGIEVFSMEAMPKKMCLKCCLHLEKSNLFRTKCKNLEAKMRKHLRIINAGRVSHVFDDDDDDTEEEYIESIKVINALSQQLGDDQNGNCKHQIDFELEKQRIFNEAQANFEQKLKVVEVGTQQKSEEADKKLKAIEERLKNAEDDLEIQRREAKFERDDVIAEMTAAHEAEIKRIKDEAEAKSKEQLKIAQKTGPSLKRMRSVDSSELETVVLNGDLVSVAVPVADKTTYTMLETGELEFVEFIPYPDDGLEDGKVHPCGACTKEFSDQLLGKFRRRRDGISYDFCSNSCAGWFDVISDAEILLKDDFTESEYNAWLEENGPVEPFVMPPSPPPPMIRKTPSHRQSIQRQQPTTNVMIKQEIDQLPSQMVQKMPKFRQPNAPTQRPQLSANVMIKQEECNLVGGNGKFCFTCKKNVIGGGISTKRNNIVSHFCNAVCLSRAESIRPPETVAIKREMVQIQERRPSIAFNPANPAARFYCEVCDKSYTLKGSLKTHFLHAHPNQTFNGNIHAEIRSNP